MYIHEILAVETVVDFRVKYVFITIGYRRQTAKTEFKVGGIVLWIQPVASSMPIFNGAVLTPSQIGVILFRSHLGLISSFKNLHFYFCF